MIDLDAIFDNGTLVELTEATSDPISHANRQSAELERVADPGDTSDADERAAIIAAEAETEVVSRAWKWGDLVPVGWRPRAWAERLTYLADQSEPCNPTGAASMRERAAKIHKRLDRTDGDDNPGMPLWAKAMLPELPAGLFAPEPPINAG